MCGFTGFYAFKSDRSRNEYDNLVRSMADCITHRGPDYGDTWQDPAVALAFGHRRLSILDLSEHGHQPMASASDRYIIVFNGEIYNHLELRKSYLSEHSFAGHSDTETLLALLEAKGFEKTLELINGMFAFAIWDRSERVLHFARDRFGKKPLYIGWAKDTLLFGSELKSFHAYPDFKGEISQQSHALYTQYNCIPAPRSIYEDVWQLLPGCSLTINVESLEAGSNLAPLMKPYWSADKIIQSSQRMKISDDDAVEQFESLLMACVKDRMLSDVPLGAFLSGGIDSSTIVALMQKSSARPVNTYTIGFDVPGYNEADSAREIAEHLGTNHHEHVCTAQDALEVIPQLSSMYDEPFSDQSAIPTYLVSKFTRQDVTVALSGDGGDEMLGGYSRHFTAPKIAALPSCFRYLLNAIPASALKTLFPHKPLMAKHLAKASAILSADSHQKIYQTILSNWDQTPLNASLNTSLNLAEHSALGLSEELMLWDSLHYLPNDILTKVDRASMAVSLEARAPLLDQRVFEYVWRLPLDLKIRDGQGKWLLREVLARHVPRAMFERPKQGFNMPIGTWLRTDLRDWAEDLLDETRLQEHGYYDATRVRSIWDKHLKGQGHYDEALWNILMFQAWHRTWQ